MYLFLSVIALADSNRCKYNFVLKIVSSSLIISYRLNFLWIPLRINISIKFHYFVYRSVWRAVIQRIPIHPLPPEKNNRVRNTIRGGTRLHVRNQDVGSKLRWKYKGGRGIEESDQSGVYPRNEDSPRYPDVRNGGNVDGLSIGLI